jgi:invasion protein IalB
VKVASNFGQWALVCDLVQALLEKETQKLVFRVSVGYGPKGKLILRIDGPTGVALQKGLEFSPGEDLTLAVPNLRPARL